MPLISAVLAENYAVQNGTVVVFFKNQNSFILFKAELYVLNFQQGFNICCNIETVG